MWFSRVVGVFLAYAGEEMSWSVQQQSLPCAAWCVRSLAERHRWVTHSTRFIWFGFWMKSGLWFSKVFLFSQIRSFYLCSRSMRRTTLVLLSFSASQRISHHLFEGEHRRRLFTACVCLLSGMCFGVPPRWSTIKPVRAWDLRCGRSPVQSSCCHCCLQTRCWTLWRTSHIRETSSFR